MSYSNIPSRDSLVARCGNRHLDHLDGLAGGEPCHRDGDGLPVRVAGEELQGSSQAHLQQMTLASSDSSPFGERYCTVLLASLPAWHLWSDDYCSGGFPVKPGRTQMEVQSHVDASAMSTPIHRKFTARLLGMTSQTLAKGIQEV